MIRRFISRLRKNERGAAIVEFALVVWILILLVLGIIEFGWLFNGWIKLTGAAREGARVAAVDTNDDNAIQAALDHTNNFESEPSVVIVRQGETVTCEITGNLEPLIGFFQQNDFVIDVNATMRREYSLQ